MFSYVGEDAPANLSDWKFEGNITRTKIDVLFDSTVVAGAKVFLTASWLFLSCRFIRSRAIARDGT